MILVIGAGVIGLSIAWRLACKGFPVQILEAYSAPRQASWAAAGMLSPFTEAHHGLEALMSMGRRSLDLYPRFLQQLSQDSGVEVSMQMDGSLFVGVNRDDTAWLRHRYDQLKPLCQDVEWLNADLVRAKEPLLTSKVTGGLWMASEGQVNNRTLLSALKSAFLRRGGVLLENRAVKNLWLQSGRVAGVELQDSSRVEGNLVINCAGAWAPLIEPTAVTPNKGQILTVNPDGARVLSGVVRTPRVYLVPKDNGTLRIGATSEDVGFDLSVSAGAVLDLLEHAAEILPAIRDCRLVETIASVRPQTADGLPIIGPAAISGYYQACGHGRHGILLAPLTAHQIVEELLCQYNVMAKSFH